MVQIELDKKDLAQLLTAIDTSAVYPAMELSYNEAQLLSVLTCLDKYLRSRLVNPSFEINNNLYRKATNE